MRDAASATRGGPPPPDRWPAPCRMRWPRASSAPRASSSASISAPPTRPSPTSTCRELTDAGAPRVRVFEVPQLVAEGEVARGDAAVLRLPAPPDEHESGRLDAAVGETAARGRRRAGARPGGAACRDAWSPRRSRGCATTPSTGARRLLPWGADGGRLDAVAGRGLGRRPRAPARRVESPRRRRGAAFERAGRRPHGAGVVRRGGARADGRGGARGRHRAARRCSRSRRRRSTPGSRPHARALGASLRDGDRVLVCDVGGGTTDFTLIGARRDGRRRCSSASRSASTCCSAATTSTSR